MSFPRTRESRGINPVAGDSRSLIGVEDNLRGVTALGTFYETINIDLEKAQNSEIIEVQTIEAGNVAF